MTSINNTTSTPSSEEANHQSNNQTDSTLVYKQLVTELPPRPRTVEEKLANHRLVQRLKERQAERAPKRGGGWRTGGKLLRFTLQSISLLSTDGQAEDIMLESVRCDEFSYWHVPCPLPTMARGLFIRMCGADDFLPKDDPGIKPDGLIGQEVLETSTKLGYEIVIRGYDKFFSYNEMPSTKMEALKANTTGPYEVSTKENGCIVFVAALSPTQLVVSSKNSLGDDNAPSHPQVGRKWLHQHLKQANRTQQEFCQFLYDQQVTAVFELCDDDFEEHIVAYPSSRRGLYLHGINRNTTDLQTWPIDQVERVAIAFGFHVTQYRLFDTLEEVIAYCESIQSEQTIYDNGKQMEGFVIRSKYRSSSSSSPSSEDGRNKVFFFKYKFDEPYLMFREWRELTKRWLAGNHTSPRYEWSVDYLKWCKAAYKTNPELFANYQNNHGIIAVRNAFLDWWQAHNKEPKGAQQLSNKTRKHLNQSAFNEPIVKKPDMPTNLLVKKPLNIPVKKLVIAPVATIGCGKTTLSRALADLLKAEHVQNDNIEEGRGKRVKFNAMLVKALENHDIVIADRNNHMPDHRKNIAETVRSACPQAALVIIYFKQAEQGAQFELALQRIQERGEHHQLVTPSKTPNYRGIIRMFLRDFTPPDPKLNPEDAVYDLIISIESADTVENNLNHVLSKLLPITDISPPSSSEIAEAANKSLQYRLPIDGTPKVSSRIAVPTYIGVEIKPDAITDRLVECLKKANQLQFYEQLVADQRVSVTFHVTLCHVADRYSTPWSKDMWNTYMTHIQKSDQSTPPLDITINITHIVWNNEVMALKVDLVAPDWIRSTNEYPHITIGTRSDVIRARQSNVLMQKAFTAVKSTSENDATSSNIANKSDILDASLRQSNTSYASKAAKSIDNIAPTTITTITTTTTNNNASPSIIKLDEPWMITAPLMAYYK
ncbi:RNA ligase-domain-containing protein [Syncephalis plumigaleata]|nr:RNA ligase-domain-containing protein [Syncephalis plumigaleata]